MQEIEKSKASIATVAVHRYLETVRKVQGQWRTMLAVRKTQKQVGALAMG